MKYPLEEADFKTEEKPTVFEAGKWYECTKSNGNRFRPGCYYLCVKSYSGHMTGYSGRVTEKIYLADDNGLLFLAEDLNSKFSGPH